MGSKTEHDLRLAQLAFHDTSPLTDGACFHAQKCAEKYLKALLVEKNYAFTKTHDLVDLSDQCQNVGIILPVDPDDLELLSGYAVRVRYPGAMPTIEDANDALKTAQAVRRFARKFLNVDLRYAHRW